MSETRSSWVPPVSKKKVITCFIALGWSFIALIAATAIGRVSYHEVKYLFWGISISFPVWIFFVASPNARDLSAMDEKRLIMAMIVTFVVFVIVTIAAMLQGNI